MVRRIPDVASEFALQLEELPTADDGAICWSEVYGAARPFRIEVGVGNSPFLIEVARGAPNFNYLGFEYSRRRVVKFLKRVEKAGLENIRMLRLSAGELLARLLPPCSVDHVYVNHPDPWPKRRHAKNRFVREPNVEILCKLLVVGGGISLRTDASDYAEQMLRVLDSFRTLENLAGAGRYAPAPREPFETPYEQKFRAQGRAIYYLEYRKCAG